MRKRCEYKSVRHSCRTLLSYAFIRNLKVNDTIKVSKRFQHIDGTNAAMLWQLIFNC